LDNLFDDLDLDEDNLDEDDIDIWEAMDEMIVQEAVGKLIFIVQQASFLLNIYSWRAQQS
jgi:hypothetical protein